MQRSVQLCSLRWADPGPAEDHRSGSSGAANLNSSSHHPSYSFSVPILILNPLTDIIKCCIWSPHDLRTTGA